MSGHDRRIIRHYSNGKRRTVREYVSLAEAREHCSRSDTSGVTRKGVKWFDGFDYMPGYKPEEKTALEYFPGERHPR